jgi:hypothetical protein
MRRFPPAETHFNFDLVPVLQEPSRRPHPHLQIVVVRARSQAHLFDLGNVLVLLGVTRALVRLELEFAKIGNAAHRRFGRRGNFDQIQPGFFGSSNGLFCRHHANLLAFGVQDAHFGRPNLTICTRTSRRGWPRDEWWTRNRRSPNSSECVKCKAFRSRAHARIRTTLR